MNAVANLSAYRSAVAIPAVAAMMAHCPADLGEEDRESMAVEFADKIERRTAPDHSKPARALINRADLRAAMEAAKLVAEKRPTVAVLSNVRIAAHGAGVIVTATDIDLEIHASIPAAADFDFGVTIPAHLLETILKKSTPGEFVEIATPAGLHVNHKGEPLPAGEYRCEEPAVLEFERARYNLNCIATSDFPILGDATATNSFSMPGADLRKLLERTRGAVSTEETRYYLNGIFMHAYESGNMMLMRAVSTDGHRLYSQEIMAPEGVSAGFGIAAEYQPGAILPRNTVDLLLKLTKGKSCPEMVSVEFSATRFQVSFGNLRVVSKLIDGTFPDYQRVIPQNNAFVATFDAADMLSAIDDVTVISTERGRAVRMEWGGDGCTLSTSHPDVGSAVSEAACTLRHDGGDAHGFANGYNAKYLTDLLKEAAPDGGMVEMAMDGDAGGPAIIRGGDEGWLGVIMPMRI